MDRESHRGPLGPLSLLPGPGDTPGVWKGHGFNAIWRPHRLSTGQDRFLKLNLTDETLTFARINASTTNSIIQGGGGTANTAFLASGHNPSGGYANAAHVEATFWIETIAGTGGQPDVHQLQYTQLVMLDFNGIHWPHVTVGALVKQ